MMNYKEMIAQIIEPAVGGGSAFDIPGLIEIPAESKMGDYALPCFRLAKQMRKAPHLIAKEITEKIENEAIFMKVESVNGYVNMLSTGNTS